MQYIFPCQKVLQQVLVKDIYRHSLWLTEPSTKRNWKLDYSLLAGLQILLLFLKWNRGYVILVYPYRLLNLDLNTLCFHCIFRWISFEIAKRICRALGGWRYQITNVDCFLFRPYTLISLLLQDYTHTNYPATLPLRRPYSGDPGTLLVFLVEVARDFL